MKTTTKLLALTFAALLAACGGGSSDEVGGDLEPAIYSSPSGAGGSVRYIATKQVQASATACAITVTAEFDASASVSGANIGANAVYFGGPAEAMQTTGLDAARRKGSISITRQWPANVSGEVNLATYVPAGGNVLVWASSVNVQKAC